MELHCLRHGLTVENAKGIYHSRADGVLTTEQREALGHVCFEASRYDAIYCSPLGRCRDTASALGIDAWIADARIVERDFGIFEGLTADECARANPEAFRAFQALDAEFRIPGGESRAEHWARTLDWLRAIAVHERVLAITHGGTIDFLYRLARGVALHGGGKIYSASPASLSRFEVRWPSVALLGHDEPLA
jgi:broad specificity phosphatase PhoE